MTSLDSIRVVRFLIRVATLAETIVGVANSTPRAEFFLSKEEHYQWLASTDHWASAVNTTSDQIPHLWASAQVIAGLAKERDNGILNYISTDNVARDMLRISQAAGQEKLQYWGFS